MTDELFSLRAILLSAVAERSRHVPAGGLDGAGAHRDRRCERRRRDMPGTRRGRRSGLYRRRDRAGWRSRKWSRPRTRNPGRRSWCCWRRRIWPSSRSRPMRSRPSRCGPKWRGGWSSGRCGCDYRAAFLSSTIPRPCAASCAKFLAATRFAVRGQRSGRGCRRAQARRASANSTSSFSTTTCRASTAWRRWPSSSARSGA